MLKKSAIRRILISTICLLIMLIIYFFPKKEDIKESLSYIEKQEIPIFLVDKNNYVARTSIISDSKKDEDKIKDIIESLIIDSHKSSYIKEGFNAIIPKNTKVLNYDLKDNILTINFSKELLDIKNDNIDKLLEVIVYSLMEINSIKKIKILVDNIPLYKVFNNKKIPEYLDKDIGINKIYNIDSLKDITKTTIYYIGKNNNYYYYIPITKISNDKKEKVEIIINELKSTPIYNTNLISYLKASANLTNYELLENSINLSFDNHILANLDDNDILEEVKYSIALSIRDNYDIYKTIFNIPNSDKIVIDLNA